MKKTKVKATLVTKEFELFKNRSEQVKSIFALKQKKVPHFWALKGVSFEIFEGEAIGIIGINGSGKSTLANIISNVIPPTSGSINVNGKVSIIAIGAGLNARLTGRENIRLKALMMGLSNSEVDEIEEKVITFAELGAFIDQPVKKFSSGMKSRLGFAIAIHQNPDILIIDEALSVGDQTFYQKCIEKMMEFKKNGKTIIFVSHALNQVSTLCDRVLWMHYGNLVEDGETGKVLGDYKKFIKKFNSMTKEKRSSYQKEYKQKQIGFKLSSLKNYIEKTFDEKNLPSRRYREKEKKLLSRNKNGEKLSIFSWIFIVVLILAIFCDGGFLVRNSETINQRTNYTAVSSNSYRKQSVETKKIEKNNENEKNKKSKAQATSNKVLISGTSFYLKEKYVVQSGDSGTLIAQKFDIPYNMLQEANPDMGENVMTGQTLLIPEK